MSMGDRDGQIWYDGRLVPWRDATTHVLTHSLHYGLAVFEGVRAYKTGNGTAIFRLKEHTERLFNSAHIYRMKIPYTRDEVMEAQKEVVRANRLDECYIRPIAFYGSEKMGVSPQGELPPDFDGQCRQAIANVRAVLEQAGMTLADIVKMSFFLVRREDMAGLVSVREDLLDGVRPAVTTVIVAGLVHPDWLVEIEAVACAD